MRSLLFSLLLQASPETRFEFRELHMGMEVRVVLYAPTDSVARVAARTAFDRIATLENIFSDYRPDSELRRLERSGAAQLSPELFYVLSHAIEVARHSNRAFDPTIAPLVSLWRETRRTRQLPDAHTTAAARVRVGYRRITLDSTTRTTRLAPGTRLDLGGIAKGYIVQQALHALAAFGVSRAMIEAGGDIAVGAPPPGAKGWNIADAGLISNAVVSTSGPGEQFIEIEGTRYSHVLDPRTGLGLTNARQVTVIAKDGATADAVATALTILGEPEGRLLVKRYRHVIYDVRSRLTP